MQEESICEKKKKKKNYLFSTHLIQLNYPENIKIKLKNDCSISPQKMRHFTRNTSSRVFWQFEHIGGADWELFLKIHQVFFFLFYILTFGYKH